MLSPILKKSDCAACKFCCSFRRKSLWETPVFLKDDLEKIKELFPLVKFRSVGNSSVTVELSHLYKSDREEEEVACPFLNGEKGCLLPPELKPFDCNIWPFRAVRIDNEKIAVALTPTCKVINQVSRGDILALLKSGLGEKIIDYAKKNPDIIKESSSFLSDILYPDSLM